MAHPLQEVIGIMQEDDTLGGSLPSTSLLRAAEYVRMSTEHQQYSTENQAAKIREYAERRGISIVRTYAYTNQARSLLPPCWGHIEVRKREIITMFASSPLPREWCIVKDVNTYKTYR